MKIRCFIVLNLVLGWAATALAATVSAPDIDIAAGHWNRYRSEAWFDQLPHAIIDIEAYPNDVTPLCHIVHLDPNGFILLSADNEIEPVIAFSATGALTPSDLDDPFWSLLISDLEHRTLSLNQPQKTTNRSLKSNTTNVSSPATLRWEQLLNPPSFVTDRTSKIRKSTASLSQVSDVRVPAFVTTRWGQGDVCYQNPQPCYNTYTPGNDVCGCVATAMAQVLYYYQHPSQGIGVHSFSVSVDGNSQTLTTRGGDGAGGPYAWSDMPKSPNCSVTTTQRQALGALCYDAAVSVETEFTATSSGATLYDAANVIGSLFGYDNVVFGHSDSGHLADFIETINPNLDAGRPIIMGIFASSVGHAAIVDGYGYDGTTLYHHLNMGWQGYYDLWYNLPTIPVTEIGTFDTIDDFLYNISPNSQGELVSGRVVDDAGQPLSGAQVTATWSASHQTHSANSRGIFWFEVSANTKVTLQASANGYETGTLTVSTGKSLDFAAGGGNVWGCDFYLNPVLTGPATWQLSISSTDGGQVTDPGEGTFTYDDGIVVDLTATPDEHYHFMDWTGPVANASSATTTLTLTEDTSATAHFSPDQYQVTVSSTTGGSTDQDGIQTLNYGDSLTITPVANTGYHFTGWSGDASGSDNPLSLTVGSSLHITANFALNQCQVTIHSTTGGSTDQDGTQTLNYGDSLTIAPAADSGYHFSGWSGDATGSSKPLSLTVAKDLNITAHFTSDQQQCTLTLSSHTGGSVISPGEGTFTFDRGSHITLNAQAKSGFRFKNWSGNLYSTINPFMLTLNNDMSISADFAALPSYHLDVHSTAGGVITRPISSSGEFLEGSTVTISVHAVDPNTFVFLGWQGSAVEAGRVADPAALTTTVLLKADSTVEARFLSLLSNIHVDDDALTDPGPGDLSWSDPEENGTELHPLDSIQEAIEVADDHTTILVHPGTYLETLNFQGKNVDVNGLALSGLNPYPVIDANHTGVVVTFNHGENLHCSLSGLVLTGGLGSPAGAIFCDGASPTIRHCLIVGNRCDDPNSAVIYCRDSNSVFEQCTISNNDAGPGGAAGRFFNCYAVITNSIIWDNGPTPILVPSGDLPEISYTTLEQGWIGLGNLNQDPYFVAEGTWTDPNDPATWIQGNYHLASHAGHWDTTLQNWIWDLLTSPCIDAGDPGITVLSEPSPHGGVINQGAYGGTRQASRSPLP